MNDSPRAGRVKNDIKLCRLSLASALLAMLLFACALAFPLLAEPQEPVLPASADITPPTISGAADISIYLGEAPAYRKGVALNDDSGADNVTLTIDSSAVILSEPGTYPVTYTATDKAGNVTSVTVRLKIEVYYPEAEELNRRLDEVIGQIITPKMNTEQKIRAVYSYVQSHIAFVNTSEKSSWQAEAHNALFVKGSGDCFSFFAASKAFFERLGIENLDIQRPADISAAMEQTHYWSMVNISDDPALGVWYHYDSCRLRAEYNHSGCLLTEVQIKAYDYVRENFYAYNKADYPEVCGIIITPTPELEEFYNKD